MNKPIWYQKTEAWLAPSWPLMVVLALIVIGVTVYFLIKRDRLPMAAWLTYLYMP